MRAFSSSGEVEENIEKFSLRNQSRRSAAGSVYHRNRGKAEQISVFILYYMPRIARLLRTSITVMTLISRETRAEEEGRKKNKGKISRRAKRNRKF